MAVTVTLRLGLLCCLLLGGACERAARLPQHELHGHTMGTEFSVKLVSPPPAAIAGSALREAIVAALEHVDALASTYRPDSEISAVNAAATTDWLPVSAEFCAVIERALALSGRTGGAFDITVGPLVNLWGFGPPGAVLEPPAEDAVAAARRRTGFGKLHTDCDVPAVRKDRNDLYLDLSGWAKGYAVDRVAALLEERGIGNYLVEIGGELRVHGHNAAGARWAVAVEQPRDAGRGVQRVVRVTDAGIATSGDYRNFFIYEGRRYSHTIDGRSGRPVAHDLASVTVLDRSAARADGMATALLVLGPEDGPALAERLGLAGYFLIRAGDGFVERTTSTFDNRTSR